MVPLFAEVKARSLSSLMQTMNHTTIVDKHPKDLSQLGYFVLT